MASGGHCYCRVPDIESPLHYTCEKCKRKFHTECLLSGTPSVLQHDFLFHFKCQACGGGEEEFTRMKLQWMQVVQLTLYNLQKEGSGMCGYFRWKEHICSFIDKHWLTFFGSYRKKTSLWHGTVAGVLSSGCPGVFVSGAQELKETGWWKLAEPIPPALNKQGTPVTKLSMKKKETPPGISPGEPPKEGLRSRRGKTSIQAAMELKAKRATLMEAKEIRKSKLSKSAETTPVKNPPQTSLLSEHLQASNLLSATSQLILPDFQVPSAAKPLSSDMMSPSAFSGLFPNEAGDQLLSSNISGSLLAEHLTSSGSLLASHTSASGSLLAEHLTSGSLPSSHVTSTGSLLSSRAGSLQDFSDENSDISQSSYLTERELRLPTTMPTLLLSEDGQDSDSDLEIDPGTMSPPASGSPIRMQESPTVQELLSTMDSESSDHRLSTLDDSNLDCSNFDSASVDTSYQGSVSMDTSNPDNISFLSNTGSFSVCNSASNITTIDDSKVTTQDDDASVVDSESESESDSGDSDGVRQTGEQTISEIVATKVRRKRKLDKENEAEVVIVPEVKYHMMSAYEERLLLRQLEQVAKGSQLPPHINRLKCKLKMRKCKREHGVALFDLDAELNKLSQRCWGLQYGVKDHQSNIPGNHYQGDMRVLDKFQMVTYNLTRSQQQQQPSFLNRLVGTEDDQLEPVCSPYTARILKPFIRRDYESRPLKMRLLQEIKAYPHRSDPTWKPDLPPSIDYCYVRPQHIPSVNALCREFFWPGIDVSECLLYPDFSCVVLYRKIVIGFAFMVPDPVLRHNEAYISFIFTHPEWRRCGVATFMVYHLIQTCMGKDVTLHVSATNSAMLLYQKFGFKPEEFILDFYDKYYPSDSTECKHAFFLRLRR